jgi:methylisocitrate lyase
MQLEKKTTLRELLAKEQIFAPCVWDCFSARAAESVGHKAAVLSGAALGFSMTGVPDVGIFSGEELIWATERLCNYTELPIIVDADDGYGETSLVAYNTCRRLAKAGAMAITLDDTTGFRGYLRWGKDFRAGVAAGKVDGNVPHPVISQEQWLSKIRAALDGVAGTDCILIARTESKLGVGFEDAIERCVRATELGAEMTLIMGLKSLDECERVNKVLPGWKMYPDVSTVNGKPDIELDDVAKYGFNLVTCHYLENASMYGMMDFGKHTVADRNTVYADARTPGHAAGDDLGKNTKTADGAIWMDWEKEWKGEKPWKMHR